VGRSPEPFTAGSVGKSAGNAALGFATSTIGGEAVNAGVDEVKKLFSRDMELD
jgi:hypothetical protein